jgi:ferrous iron transport protein B
MLLSKLVPETSPGLILEMPVYRIPTLRTVSNKAWWRIREFVVEAWPLLIVGSIVLAIFNYLNIAMYLNSLVRPLSWALGLPNEVGVPLIFGVLRKELSLVMLGQALGSMEFSQVLTPIQMITYSVFVVFYMPCMATMVVIRKELGSKAMWNIAGLTTLIATLAALFSRGFAELIF